jgi:Protein of unknown function (DUF3237)
MTWGLAEAGGAALGRTVRALVEVSPSHPANAVKAIYSLGGGPDCEVRGHAIGQDRATGTQTFAIDLPRPVAGLAVLWRPVLMRSGRVLDPVRRGAAPEALPVPAEQAAFETAQASGSPDLGEPRRFPMLPIYLFRSTVPIIPDAAPAGQTPEGMPFYFSIGPGGTVRGPALEAEIVPRDGDRLRMRPDGIGIAEVEATLLTPQGDAVLTFYSGLIDIGPDGYAALLSGRPPQDAPARFAPRYLTSSRRLGWMNRLQAFAIGEASLQRRLVEYDVYAFGPADLPI